MFTMLRLILCKFADDNTLYRCGENTEDFIENLHLDLKAGYTVLPAMK